MHRLGTFLVAVFFACCLGVMPGTARASADGKALFERNKCIECHAIAAEGIAMVPGEDAEAEDDPFGMEDEGEKEDAPDLSAIGKKRDAAWLTAYLQKKEKADSGKKHPPRFRGTAATLEALTAYLAGLKTEAPGN